MITYHACTSELLFPNEWMEYGAGFPALCRFFPGDCNKPLIVFVPGGGFLARIGYGHPGSEPTDFLCGCLQKAGYSVLAQSYPSDHPVFRDTYPEMTVSDWGGSVASITAEVINRERLLPDVLLVGWSMAGRMAQAFNRNAAGLGLNTIGFVSLAANGPLPGLAPLPKGAMSLTPQSLWNVLECAPAGTPYLRQWTDELTRITSSLGQALFTEEICQLHYLTNCPVNLREEMTRFRNGRLEDAVDDAMADLGSLDFADHPLTASIVPTMASDAKHALTDQATFAFLNSRKIYDGLSPGILKEISSEAWDQLRTLILDLPHRLTRFQNGGHFFFIGAEGAATTARHIGVLLSELETVKASLARICRP